MSFKSKLIVLLVTVVSISYFSLHSLYADEAHTASKSECCFSKGDNPSSCKLHSGGETKQGCCKYDKSIGHHKKGCHHKPKCDVSGGKKGKGFCPDEMLKLVNCAKKELLKEKIKANLETKVGTKLDRVAELLVDTAIEECKAGIESKERRDELKKKLKEIISEN